MELPTLSQDASATLLEAPTQRACCWLPLLAVLGNATQAPAGPNVVPEPLLGNDLKLGLAAQPLFNCDCIKCIQCIQCSSAHCVER